ncbi:TPA: class I SAM-dependent methyltransferase [Raoultella ornithinolytica]|uniref:class I SAM-dependent methyltransferase n=1 Tax=Raoultella ornithinolytica TaxID=54291 RepID=UPI002DBFF9DF|nr:methyltransferase [Raoultella ornithinolytica]MEB7959380.1 methyltransferase [Raoultella ornithinolytica]
MHNNPHSHSAGAALTRGCSYLRQFIADPRTTGALLPSSAVLCRAMMNQVDWGVSLSIAELGAANGVLTRGILSRMRRDAMLDAYEINPGFIGQLRTIDDRRLNVVAASAERLINPYDIVFSCLPLLSLPLRISMRILNQIRQQMSADGLFIQFQYSPLSETLLSRYFRWQRIVVMRNLPPALVYVCTLR